MRKNLRFSAVAGVVLVLLLVLAMTTCELDFLEDNGSKKVEYTDVWYSPDGTMITLYLDGVGIPVAESNRALNRDMAKFSYNYLEAVFVYGTPGAGGSVARARWSIGQTAGIRGVPRGATNKNTTTNTGGVNYGEVYGDPCATIFVGRDDGTLLGVGSIAWVDDPRGQSLNGAAGDWVNTTIDATTQSVTFLVSALYTGLPEESSTDTTVVVEDSTFFTAAGAPQGTGTGESGNVASANGSNTIVYMNALDGTNYPLFYLPNGRDVVKATYEIQADAIDGADGTTPITLRQPLTNTVTQLIGASDQSLSTGLNEAIRLADPVDRREQVLLRIPSYQSGGQVRDVVESYYYRAIATLDNNDGAVGDEFNPKLEFTFNTEGHPNNPGIFAFGFDIPVFAITNADSTNGADGAYNWYVRSSFGQARYLLDDGLGAGGLVLMGVNVTATDWLELYCKWR